MDKDYVRDAALEWISKEFTELVNVMRDIDGTLKRIEGKLPGPLVVNVETEAHETSGLPGYGADGKW